MPAKGGCERCVDSAEGHLHVEMATMVAASSGERSHPGLPRRVRASTFSSPTSLPGAGHTVRVLPRLPAGVSQETWTWAFVLIRIKVFHFIV